LTTLRDGKATMCIKKSDNMFSCIDEGDHGCGKPDG